MHTVPVDMIGRGTWGTDTSRDHYWPGHTVSTVDTCAGHNLLMKTSAHRSLHKNIPKMTPSSLTHAL